MECSVEGCDRAVVARGWCPRHWKQWKRTGEPVASVAYRLRVSDDPLDEFISRVIVTDQMFAGSACWDHRSRVTPEGYHKLGDTDFVHRLAYELLVGPIPEGKELDHLCRRRWCCNPRHLEPVTAGQNVLRGEGPSAVHARKTHCIHGHEFTEENTRRYGPNRRWRACRACDRERR